MAREARLRVVGVSPPEDAMQEAVESFLRRGQARSLSRHTLRYYRVRLEAFTRYLERKRVRVLPAEVTPALVRDFLASETERVSALTASHSFITLRAFFRFLIREDVLTESPMQKVEKPRVARKVIDTFTPAQVEAMLGTCKERSFNGARLRAVILTLLDCGLRV